MNDTENNQINNNNDQNGYDISTQQIIVKLRALVAQSGMSREEISEKADVPLSTIHKLLSGQTKEPRYTTLKKIVVACHGSFDELMDIMPVSDEKQTSVDKADYDKQREALIEQQAVALKWNKRWVVILAIALAVMTIYALFFEPILH